MSNFRDDSRINYVSQKTVEHINAGSLQRIADATEKMAAKYTQIEKELEAYKNMYKERGLIIDRLTRSNNALRGYIKRIKNKP